MSPSIIRFLPWLGAALLTLALPAVAGEVYQWKDAKGVTHYSDAPPPDKAYKNRTLKQEVPAPTQTAAAPSENPQCVTARTNLAHLKSDAPVGLDADKDGKPDTVMNAEQRAAQVQLAEAAIKASCTPAPTAKS